MTVDILRYIKTLADRLTASETSRKRRILQNDNDAQEAAKITLECLENRIMKIMTYFHT